MEIGWGRCDMRGRRTWLYLELAKKPSHGPEYALVSEMFHLLEAPP